MEKQYMKIIAIGAIIEIVLVFYIFKYRMFHLLPLPHIIFFAACITSVILIFKNAKEYVKHVEDIKKYGEKRKFKYIDSFYFKAKVDYETDTAYYYIIEDYKNKRYYALKRYFSIDHYLKRGRTIKKGDIGYYWIDKVLDQHYKKVDNGIMLGEHLVEKMEDIKSSTQEFTPSLLDKITFIDGYIEFDNQNK